MCDAEEQEQLPAPSPTAQPELQKTADYYRVREDLPERFNYPSCFKGYSKKQVHPLYKTTNQTYGSRPPTVHEMPTSFSSKSNAFSNHLAQCGMYRNNGFNTHLETSDVTGPDNYITFYDRLNFHKSYNLSGPSNSG
ncbi:piercer of microtubule wall 1 protein [Ambystoma mexicanum]|uniref:piercer of microtubule wall 1 protein n=1 Tax=Ambystoma mexicanum TaxID=8296 RepID=UPI0037E913DD